MKKTHYIAAVAAALLISSTAWAGALTIPNTFTAGTPAVAADVNANFAAGKTAVDDNNARINTVTASAATNTTDIASNATAITNLQNAALVRTSNVSPVIGGGGVIDAVASGTALINAVAGITGSSVTNQFTVKLEPGTYDLVAQTLTLPDGVNLEGSGQEVSTIISAVSGADAFPLIATVDALGNSTIRKITIENNGPLNAGVTAAASLAVRAGTVYIENAKIISSALPITVNGVGSTPTTLVSNSRIVTTAASAVVYTSQASLDTLKVVSSEFGNPGAAVNIIAGTATCFSSYKSDFTAVPAACK